MTYILRKLSIVVRIYLELTVESLNNFDEFLFKKEKIKKV